MPKDDPRLARLPAAPLSPKELAILQGQLPSPEQLWSPALKNQLMSLRSPELLAKLGSPERRLSPAAVESTLRGLIEQRQAITVLEHERDARRREIAAIELEIAGRRETVRTIEEYLARAGETPHPLGATSPPAKPPAPASATPNSRAAVPAAPDPSPTPEPDEIGKEEQDGPQAELVRSFFREVYSGHPPKKIGYRGLHKRMEGWVAEKNKLDGGNRIAASETTIRRVRTAP